MHVPCFLAKFKSTESENIDYSEEVWLQRDCSSVIQVSISSIDEGERDSCI